MQNPESRPTGSGDSPIGRAFRRSLGVIVLLALGVVALVYMQLREPPQTPADDSPVSAPRRAEPAQAEPPPVSYT